MAVKVGDRAPEFTLKNTAMQDVSLSSFKGKNVVLLFFPAAFTGVCTTEMTTCSRDVQAYKGLNAEVVGISTDLPFSLKAWADKEGITVPLLSDFNRKVAAAYGVQYESFLGVFAGVAKRSAFVIDKGGVVRFASSSDDPKVLPDFEAVKACLQSLN
jgi:peroxiredoxin